MKFLIILCIFLTVWQGIIVFFRAAKGQNVTWFSLITFAAGLTGVITYSIGLWG